jgi:hypothetical protein
MMLVRTEMGAHKTYGQFRGAKEILEMLGLDPEEAADAKTLAILEELKWTGQPKQSESALGESSTAISGQMEEIRSLQTEVRILNTNMEANMNAQAATIDAQAATLEALKAQNALLLATIENKKKRRKQKIKEGKGKEGGGSLETKTNDGGSRLPVAASLQKSAGVNKDTGSQDPLEPKATRKVYKMPSTDRNPESLNDNYTASGRTRSKKSPGMCMHICSARLL